MAKILLEGERFEVTLNRLACELIEKHNQFENTVLIGLQPRGIYLAKTLQQRIFQLNNVSVTTGRLDITFYRDDFRRRDLPIMPSALDINFSIENQHVLLVDDVFFTGRTVRSGLEAMLAFGRPASVELVVLVNRKYSRQLPIEADYVGINIDTRVNERVKVKWQETDNINQVWLLTEKESNQKDSKAQ